MAKCRDLSERSTPPVDPACCGIWRKRQITSSRCSPSVYTARVKPANASTSEPSRKPTASHQTAQTKVTTPWWIGLLGSFRTCNPSFLDICLHVKHTCLSCHKAMTVSVLSDFCHCFDSFLSYNPINYWWVLHAWVQVPCYRLSGQLQFLISSLCLWGRCCISVRC